MWGREFRPDYRNLNKIRERLPRVLILALTATATSSVKQNIIDVLQIPGAKVFIGSFNRKNLQFVVKKKRDEKTAVEDIVKTIKSQFQNASGIVYCMTKNNCDVMAAKLNEAGIKALSYHSDLDDTKRAFIQNEWTTNKIAVICATVAFGMGVNKANVRYVIQSSIPKSFKSYHQECGRAGRDGLKSTCILYHSYFDKIRFMKLIYINAVKESIEMQITGLNRMAMYCENLLDCRRISQCSYFDEHYDGCLLDQAIAT